MKRLKTSAEEIEYLKELNKNLLTELRLAVALLELKKTSTITLIPFIRAIKQSERGYK